MATLDEFMAVYQAFYGKFPLELDRERDRDALAIWRKWMAPITPYKMDKIFKTLNEHRATQGTRVKPLLEAFKRAQSGSLPGPEATSQELRDAEEKMKKPLFDFTKEGFPRRREAFLIELPKAVQHECWGALGKMPQSEFREKIKVWYAPEWADYDLDEKKRLCQSWGIRMPEEEEIPF